MAVDESPVVVHSPLVSRSRRKKHGEFEKGSMGGPRNYACKRGPSETR